MDNTFSKRGTSRSCFWQRPICWKLAPLQPGCHQHMRSLRHAHPRSLKLQHAQPKTQQRPQMGNARAASIFDHQSSSSASWTLSRTRLRAEAEQVKRLTLQGQLKGGGRGVNEGRTAGSRLVVQTLARSHFAVSVRTRRGRSHCCKPPPSFSEAGVEKCRETLPPSGSELAVGMKLCIERNHRTKRDVRSDADACASDGAS